MIKPSEKIAIINGERNITFSQMLRYVSLYSKFTPQEKGSKTLVLSENREEWIYAFLSVWNNRGIMVPVDAASTAHDVAYILRDCQPQAMWVSDAKMDLATQALAEAGMDVQLLRIDEVAAMDPNTEEPAHIEYDLQDTCLICYTSGTTGQPKGVMLSLDSVMSNVQAISQDVHIFDATRRTLILLPLHHVLPLVGTIVMPMVIGGGVAICPSLSGPDIMDTLQRGQIGIMIGVPRLWQTLYNGIRAKIDQHAITRALYNICERVQSRTLSRLIFKSVHQKMGGHIAYCVSGGAALDHRTAVGLKTLGLDVLEGFGMTEAAPMIAFTRPGDIVPGSVGPGAPRMEIKLIDGELCARGRNVMQGYYNRPEETAEVLDADGFLHTGDLATIDEKGRIFITGRKKEIIVLSNGKNVNPTEIEEKLEQYPDIVKEAAVTQRDDLLCAIIVPQPAWAQGRTTEEMETALKREVLEPYNVTVAPYKKVMSVHVYEGELPRTRMEKLQRFKLQELLQGKLQPAAPKAQSELANDDTALGIIARYIMAEKHLDEVKATDHLETDLAMDSLDKVTLQGFIEQTFGMKISADELTGLATVQAIANCIEKGKTRTEVEDIDWQKILADKGQQLDLPHMAYTGILFTRCCKWLYGLMFHTQVRGLENIPAEGPCILAPNHQSFLDAPLVVSHISADTLRNTYFYAKKAHVRSALRQHLAHSHNIIVMDMSTLKDSIQMLGQVLRDGKNLVIFPEGTRTRNGQVGKFKKTFAILARELNVPVVPVRIEGAYEAWPRQKRLPHPHPVSIEYLPAITPMPDESYDELAERVRSAISEK